MAGKGKEWEAQLGTALKAAKAWKFNSNNYNPASDFTANWKGLGMLLEAKETHSDTLAFSAVTDNQVRLLAAVHEAGGFAAVAICRAYPNKRRAFLCHWPAWLHLQATIGRKSIPLKDGQRPAELVELARIDRAHGLGMAFDLAPALQPHLVALAQRINLEFPEAFPNEQAQTSGAGGPGDIIGRGGQARPLSIPPGVGAIRTGLCLQPGRETLRGLRVAPRSNGASYSPAGPRWGR